MTLVKQLEARRKDESRTKEFKGPGIPVKFSRKAAYA